MLTYGSVCSGIESASVAWEPLGWKPAWFAEIESFPSAVLAHHWPDVQNHGDMTLLPKMVLAERIPAPDILVGGTPCQSWSIAGKREGLADPRGQLTLKFVELANAIDHIRAGSGERECVVCWENVPGVLSDKENGFGHFLAALVGESEPLVPTGGRWTDAGCVYGPKRSAAWRVLDAQYFGLAQRRRRVFLVASARKGFDPAAVLFESEGLRRDSPPSREARENFTHDVAPCLTSSGRGVERGGDTRGQDQVVAALDASYGRLQGCSGQDLNHGHSHLIAFGQNNTSGPVDVSHALTAHSGSHGRPDFDSETFLVQSVSGDIAHTLKADGFDGFDGSEDGTGRGVPTIDVHGTQDPCVGSDVGFALGRNAGQENAILAFTAKDYGGDATEDLSPTLRAGGHSHSHANAGVMPAIAFAENSRSEIRLEGGDGSRVGALSTGGGKPGQGQPCIATEMSVRRLTPMECERLQGFPDGHTDVPFRGMPAADGPRYKAIGNSKAVPVVRWIGQRIAKYLETMS